MTLKEHLEAFIQYPNKANRERLRAEADRVMAELEKNQFYIDCLHMGGVDNWEWYDDSLKDYWEKYETTG